MVVFLIVGSWGYSNCLIGQTNYASGHASSASLTDSSSTKTQERLLAPSLNQYLAGVKRIFTNKYNLLYAGVGTGLALLVKPHDGAITDDLKEDDFNEFDVEAPNKSGSFYFLAGSSALTYLLGKAFNKPHLANTGLYLTEAFFTTQFATFVIKETFQRTRPDSSNNLSFPSGHTSGMFTVASVLDKRYGLKFGVPAYLWASFVGITRVKTQKHFPTDVIIGAALGIIVGRSFVPSRGKARSFAVLPVYYFGFEGLDFQIRF